MTENEYESKAGKKWDDNNHDRKYSKSIYKGQNGIYARDKLGIALQDEHSKGMLLRQEFDNGGGDTELIEKHNALNVRLDRRMGSSGESFAASSFYATPTAP